ncbi:hypothetical protein P8452_58162 [Trifolium repens]|nr:transcription factor bHLH130 [Trifolium repens]WJX74516.1 hypothetical protein P8452_58162 [Trifolium repens]
MESDLHQQQHPQVNSSGLTRFKSAPSSYFNNIIDREFYEHVFNRPSSPETERVFSRFMNSLGSEEDLLTPKISTESTVKEEEVMASINNEQVVHQQMMPPLPNQNVSSGLDGNFSMGVNRLQQVKNHGGNNSNLIRHSSSPAGLFSQINIENGYVSMRGMGTLGGVNNNSIKEAKFSNARSLKNSTNYSSGIMSTIAEIGDKDNSENNQESEIFGESHGNDYSMDYQVDTWDDSEMMSENVGGLKRFRDNDSKQHFSGLNAAPLQNETRGGHSSSPLAHQLSMPNTSSEMAAMENFLHFSDSVPMKIRAKRGCATHPRSIAERVRRTKISERMRKLQDLVPNMDKQTNTADMLDLAVDYIKDLQKQAEKLQDCQAKCTCPHKQQQ